jgi:hypothetical protein
MGTLLDLASLVTIPSGYKVGTVYSVVPTDGAGDLTFTRSNDTATRVGPNGLIEKVRTNLLTYSNDFSDASWSKITDGTFSLVTENITDAFGNTSAVYKVTLLTGSFLVFRKTLAISSSQTTTGSLYVKKTISSTFVSIDIDDNADAVSAANTNWQRITNTKSSAAFMDITTYSVNEPFYIFASQMELGDIATDYIPTTTTAVSVGPVANLPRLDYLNSTCPNLLLEPQRSNIALYSEQFNNSAWSTSNVTVTANNATSPDGYINADAIVENTATSVTRRVLPLLPFIGTGGAYYSFSAYVKKIPNQPTRHIYWMCQFGADAIFAHFNMTNFTVNQVATSGNGSNASASIIAVGNDWYRITLSGIVSNTGGDYYNQFYFENLVRTGFTPQDYTGNGTSGFYLYGWQIEAGAYATSYVPTLGAARTRGADSCSKTGISSLIGQTEGTIYFEIQLPNPASEGGRILMQIGSGSQRIYFAKDSSTQNIFQLATQSSAGYNFINTANLTTSTVKMAIAYKSGQNAFYLNGTLISTASATANPTSMSQIVFGDPTFGNSETIVKEAILFPTRLSNSELAQLTTI